jgi:5-methylcytosine-specific restriction endonuclease McrA
MTKRTRIILPPKTCEVCGKQFNRKYKTTAHEWETVKFCSTICRGISRIGKKRIFSEEHKKNIGLGHLGMKVSIETRAKLSAIRKGKIRSPEHCRKMSEVQKGKHHPHKGRVYSIEDRIIMSNARRGKLIGLSNPNWKGGIPGTIHAQRRKKAEGYHTLEEWESLKEDYGYICPKCLKKEPEIKLTVDHIVPITKGGSQYITNIQPLCLHCNMKKFDKIIKYNIPITNEVKDVSFSECSNSSV